MNLKNYFSDFILYERNKRKLSQIELCKISGLTRATYSKMECDGEQITFPNVEKALKALNLTLRDFVNYLENQKLS